MIDDGMGFQLVPWRPALEQRLGHRVSGTLTRGGGIGWDRAKARAGHLMAKVADAKIRRPEPARLVHMRLYSTRS
jgi:hypothetical protein